ncbi:hypothetical protein ACLKA7_016643 [Drosophila subpalustris]
MSTSAAASKMMHGQRNRTERNGARMAMDYAMRQQPLLLLGTYGREATPASGKAWETVGTTCRKSCDGGLGGVAFVCCVPDCNFVTNSSSSSRPAM